MLPRRSRHRWLPLLALEAGLALSSAPACESDPAEEGKSDLLAALSTLWSGSPEERRETAEDTQGWSYTLADSEVPEETVQQAVASLASILRTEKDDWIRSRVLQNLLERPTAPLTPLYREALEDPSPNVRWRGIQWFREHQDPEARWLLEALWRFEERSWVRVDLIVALDRSGSDRFLDDFIRLARGGDAALALAAVRALGSHCDDRLVPVLAALSHAQNPEVGATAIEVLASWRASPAAREAMRQALKSAGSGTLLSVLPRLGELLDEDSAGLLLQMGEDHADSAVRCSALAALEQAWPDGLEEALVKALLETPTVEMDPLQKVALFLLNQRDDAEVVSRLGHLDAALGGRFFNLGRLLKSLSRDRIADESRSYWPPPSCEETAAVLEEAPKTVVVPAAGLHSIRCWRYPAISGDPALFRRIPGDREVQVTDHFELGGEPWVEILAPDSPRCWIPTALLRPPAEKPSEPRENRLSLEFDLPIDEAGSPSARDLTAAGLLESIDPSSDVMGFALHLEPEEDPIIPRLISAYRDDGSLLDAALRAPLSALYSAHPCQAELKAFFRRPSSSGR